MTLQQQKDNLLIKCDNTNQLFDIQTNIATMK